MAFWKYSFRCILNRNFDDENLIAVGDYSIVLPPYIKLIVSHTGEFFFGLKTDHHVLIVLYCENELMHYGRRNCESKLVLAY